VLRRAPLFGALDDEAAEALSASLQESRLARGEVLFRQGDRGQHAYVVTEGKVKLGRTSSDGRENLLACSGPDRCSVSCRCSTRGRARRRRPR
jgi:CRP-like cAMP-binding protein